MEHVGDEKARFWLKVRIGLVATAFAIGFVAVVGRVYYLQTVESEALEQRVADQREGEVTRQARRGDIRDRNGAELAVSVQVPSVYARPRLLGDLQREAVRLAEILEADEAEILDQLETDSPFVWLERQTHPETAERIEELETTGVGTMTEYDRYYPMGPLAGQLLGFVGIDGEGLEGIERQFDDELSGDPFEMRVARDAGGRELALSDIPQFGTFEGHHVHLTIDEKVQRVAHEALRRQIDEYDAKGGYAVAMDVDTGDVLAMVDAPAFDPNRYLDFTTGDWRLGTVADTFEPGSVFKPFLLAGALQEGTTRLDREYDVEDGRMRIGNNTISDVIRDEEMTTTEIIQKSSNVGSYKMARQLGRETYYDYIRAFGFGARTGVGIPGEQSGVVWPSDRWAEITFANVAFGQGLSATPLQLARGVAALANGGMVMEPRVVAEVRDRTGQTVWSDEPTMVRRVLSEDVARRVAWAMSKVTEEDGTGTQGDLEHFTVAGKTGTAQQVDPETGEYDPDSWISGFVGFAPAEEPEVAVAVFVDEPEDVRYGGRVAGPAFADITEEALSQRGTLPLPPEKRFADSEGPDEAMEADIADPAPKETVVLPPRRVVDGRPDATDEQTVPNFVNLTLRQALEVAREADIVPRVTGTGVVADQQPEPGTPVEETAEVVLTLHSPAELKMTEDESALDSED